MTTATADQQTEPLPRETSIDTGPQQVLALTKQDGMTYRKAADLLHISPATVARRVRDAKAELRAQRLVYARVLMYAILTLCAMIVTAAVSSIAWS
jgi:predicted DNA-binding protein (UPF0251 family)